MSANLWSDSTASMQIRADGTYIAGKASGSLASAVTGLDSLTENQTVHMWASLKGADAGVLKPFVEYKDAAGNLNWVGFPSWQPTDSWHLFESTCVVPSGMTVIGVGFDASGATGDIEVSNPVFSYGSASVVLVSANVAVTGTARPAENQTIHMGASLKGAGAGVLKPFVEYRDAAGNLNSTGFPSWQPTGSWQRFEGTCVVPSGMTVCGVGFDASAATGDIEVSNPVFSYGSPVTLAISTTTLSWSAGILATTRYYQLASPTSATPAVPTSSGALGSWTETEPAADVTKVLWTCERTVYADGTESWSKASKSTSYEAAKDAKGTADAAKSTADSAKSAADAASSTLSTLNTQEGIFNKLTNNGALKGIYMSDGTLLINADYIKTGHISADTISGGTLLIKDSSGNVTAELSNGTDTGLMAYDPYYKKLRPLKWEAFRPIIVYSAVDQYTFESSFDNQKYTVLTSAMTNGHNWKAPSDVSTSGSDASEKAIKVIFGSNHMARITLLGSCYAIVDADVFSPSSAYKDEITSAYGEVRLDISITDDSHDYQIVEYDVSIPPGQHCRYGDAGRYPVDKMSSYGSIGTSIITSMDNKTEILARLKYRYYVNLHAETYGSQTESDGLYTVNLKKIVIEPI